MTRPFVFAWHFPTAIPLSRRHHDPTADELAASMAWYSTVGVMIGYFALVTRRCAGWMTVEVASVLVIVLLVLLTRGLHQDGLADTIDGLAGGRTVEDRLRIMRDPSVGRSARQASSVPPVALCRTVMVPQAWRVPVLLCMPAVGSLSDGVRRLRALPTRGATEGWRRYSSRISRGGMCWSRLWWWPWSLTAAFRQHGRPGHDGTGRPLILWVGRMSRMVRRRDR